MKKQNKALYESLVNGIASALKKSLNEGIESMSNIPYEYYDEDGNIDLTNIEELPKELINSLIMDLLKNGELQQDDQDGDCLMCSLQPNTDADNKNATVLTRSMEDYGVCLAFNAEVDYENIDHSAYPSNDRDVPDDPAYRECDIKDVVISGLMLTDGDQEIMINDPDIIEKVKDETLSSNVIDNFRIEQEESYDPYEMDDYYED